MRLILSISVSILENLALRHLGACIFSHCIANPTSPDVSLSHKRVDAHFFKFSLVQAALFILAKLINKFQVILEPTISKDTKTIR